MKWPSIFKGRSVSLQELHEMCTSLKELTEAGVLLLEALELLREASHSRLLRETLHRILLEVKGGLHLSEALKAYPTLFDPIFITVIQAGEKSGRLSQSFGQLAQHLHWKCELQQSLSASLRYPLLALGLVVFLLFFLITSVIPELAQFFHMTDTELPLATQTLLAVSSFCNKYFLPLLLLTFLSVGLVLVSYRTSSYGRQKIDYGLLKVPFLNQILLKKACSRFVFLLHLLLTSGVDLLEALSLAKEALKNQHLKSSVAQGHHLILQGYLLSEALAQQPIFPAFMVRMVALGEQTGQLPHTLSHIQRFFEQEIQQKTQILTTFIQPFFLCIVGGILLWVVISIFLPLYDHLATVAL